MVSAPTVCVDLIAKTRQAVTLKPNGLRPSWPAMADLAFASGVLRAWIKDLESTPVLYFLVFIGVAVIWSKCEPMYSANTCFLFSSIC